jgi:hypothetical protein
MLPYLEGHREVWKGLRVGHHGRGKGLKNDDFFIDFGVFPPTGRGVIKLNTSTVQIPIKEYIYYSDPL